MWVFFLEGVGAFFFFPPQIHRKIKASAVWRTSLCPLFKSKSQIPVSYCEVWVTEVLQVTDWRNWLSWHQHLLQLCCENRKIRNPCFPMTHVVDGPHMWPINSERWYIQALCLILLKRLLTVLLTSKGRDWPELSYVPVRFFILARQIRALGSY